MDDFFEELKAELARFYDDYTFYDTPKADLFQETVADLDPGFHPWDGILTDDCVDSIRRTYGDETIMEAMIKRRIRHG